MLFYFSFFHWSCVAVGALWTQDLKCTDTAVSCKWLIVHLLTPPVSFWSPRLPQNKANAPRYLYAYLKLKHYLRSSTHGGCPYECTYTYICSTLVYFSKFGPFIRRGAAMMPAVSEAIATDTYYTDTTQSTREIFFSTSHSAPGNAFVNTNSMKWHPRRCLHYLKVRASTPSDKNR